MAAILAVQVATFIALGALFIANGNPKLGACQLMLAVIQALIYS